MSFFYINYREIHQKIRKAKLFSNILYPKISFRIVLIIENNKNKKLLLQIQKNHANSRLYQRTTRKLKFWAAFCCLQFDCHYHLMNIFLAWAADQFALLMRSADVDVDADGAAVAVVV